MQRVNNTNQPQNEEFSIEMQSYDPSQMEGGADETTDVANDIFNAVTTDQVSASTQTSFGEEIEKMKAIMSQIRERGFVEGYWSKLQLVSKITHGVAAFITAVFTLNFLMAMWTHFFWDRAFLGHHLGDDEILVLYCQTQGCGCENGVLHRLQQLIMEHLAGDEGNENTKIYTQLYPGAPLVQFFARLFQCIQLLLLITIFFGPMICRKVYGYISNNENDKNSIRYPWFIQKLAVGGCCKKLGMFLVCFIGFNIIVALLTITGAFEVYHGRDIVFSSLDSRRMITPRDVMEVFPRLDGKESPLLGMENLDIPIGHMH